MSKVRKGSAFDLAGYTEDTKFKVIGNVWSFKEGDILTLHRDNGTRSPLFTTDDGRLDFVLLPKYGGDRLEVYQEEQPNIDSDGFTKWDGGETPVPEGTMVHVRYDNDYESIVTAGLTPSSGGYESIKGDKLAVDWGIDDSPYDIVAYKLHTGNGYVDGVKQPNISLSNDCNGAANLQECHKPFIIQSKDLDKPLKGAYKPWIEAKDRVTTDFNKANNTVLGFDRAAPDTIDFDKYVRSQEWFTEKSFGVPWLNPEMGVDDILNEFKLDLRKRLNLLAADNIIESDIVEKFDKLMREM